MKLASSFRKAAVACVAGAAAIGLAFSGATAASADPIGTPIPRTINLTGSDTTQDVMNGIANVALDGGQKYIGSYNAGTTGDWTNLGLTGATPNGSSQGLAALSAADQNLLWNGQAVAGKINAARSSSSPGSRANVNGPLQFIPFARDAVTYATAASTNVPNGIPLTATSGALSLQAIFTCVPGIHTFDEERFYTVKKVGDPESVYVGATKLEPIQLQSGSGTRSFWEGVVGTGTCVQGNAQEHRGEALENKPNALVPFSISQWIAQANAGADSQADGEGEIAGIPVTDRRFGAQLNAVGTSQPIAGGKQNSAFVTQLTRNVYNVIPHDVVGNTSTTVNRLLNKAFVGSTSDAVTATFGGASVLELFGFSKTLVGGYTPGQVSDTLRATYY